MAKSAPKHFFSKFASVNMPRSKFDMSKVNTTTLTTDYLYPVYCEEVLPGDTWDVGVCNMIRLLSPLDVPMMDNLYMTYHFWFVPMRLVWEHTKNFFGETDRDTNERSDYTIPQLQFTSDDDLVVGSIYDYFEIPVGNDFSGLTEDEPLSINVLPFRCYNLIYDEWYRDEQRCDYSYYNVGDDVTDSSEYFLLKRGKRFDYFTSSLLEPQIGSELSISLGEAANVYGSTYPFLLNVLNSDGDDSTTLGYWANNYSSGGLVRNVYITDSTISGATKGSTVAHSAIDSAYSSSSYGSLVGLVGKTRLESATSGTIAVGESSPTGLWADLSSATPASIASLRQAFQLQSYYELMARGGTRYTEYIYTQFGVISPDARLQRPEFLGGVESRLSVQPVIQTSSTDTTSPQGTLTGIVYGADSGFAFSRSFTEHGYIIGIVNVYSDLTYFQGLHRKWKRETALDFAIPVLANLTDQEIYNYEIFLQGTDDDDDVFGYAERYADYKYSQNTLTGLCRPNADESIGYWSLAQEFESLPENTSEFIESDTPIERILSVTDEDSFILNQKFNASVTRCLPMYADPMLWFKRG